MDDLIKQEFYNKYNVLFKPSLFESSDDFKYIDIKPGWYQFISTLCDHLKIIHELTGIIIVIKQIKEKFGTLRFYYQIIDLVELLENEERMIWIEIITNLVTDAENLSTQICELCGSTDSHIRQSQVYIRTLCNKHAKENGYTD